MEQHFTILTLGLAIACFNAPVNADTARNANDASGMDSTQGPSDTADGASFSPEEPATQPVADTQGLVTARLKRAEAFRNERQWERAISEYREIQKIQPDNTDAALGIGTIFRWQGNIDEAERAYEHALAVAPQIPSGMLGLAKTYVLDHNFIVADNIYDQAIKIWPDNDEVQKAADDFQRLRNPRVYLFWESDLSFSTRQGGASIPFGAREEIGAEYQEATSFAPLIGHTEIYTRSDKKLLYTHHFGLNHMLDFSARTSEYHFNVPDSDLEYSSIDTYEEYRIRYTAPLMQNQVFSVRYTGRPTTLKLTQENFVAHKIEAEFNSRWNPRFITLLGGGWLRDLDSNAHSTSKLTDRSLVKAGFQWDVTNHLSLGAKYITNPDLDNTMEATVIVEGSYSLTDTWSALGRYRLDEYKTDSNQTAYYLAARFVPDSHWWSEFGFKHAERGTASGDYGLISITYRF